MTDPILSAPSANSRPTTDGAEPRGLRARFGRRMKAHLRGTPMSTFRGEGPGGRFVLVRDRSGQRQPILLLNSSLEEGVPFGDLTRALEITPRAELIPGTWRRTRRTVSFQADRAALKIKELHGALANAGAGYGVLVLLPTAA